MLANLLKLFKGSAPETFLISERLGYGKEVSDSEFTSFYLGEHHRFSKRRLRELATLFTELPWSMELATWDAEHWPERRSSAILREQPAQALDSLKMAGSSRWTSDLKRLELVFSAGRSYASSIQVMEPSSEITKTLRPVFSWKLRNERCKATEVVLQLGEERVQSRTKLAGSTWEPKKPLIPGTLYTWTLRVETDGRTEQAQAVFSTPSRETLELTTDTLSALPNLKAGLVLLEMGRHDEALLKLEQVVGELSSEEEQHVRALLKAIKGRRKR